MKGIVKHNRRFYKKSKDNKSVKKGDLILLNCKRGDMFFQYNGVHEVVDTREIHVRRGDGALMGIKLGYNVLYDDYYKLVPVERRKSLPAPVKEEQEY
jgi:hypothetical protein